MRHRLPHLIWRVRAWATPLIDLAFVAAIVGLCYWVSGLLSNLFA